MNTKKIITAIIIASFGGQMATPLMALAAPAVGEGRAQQNFCSRLPALTKHTQEAITKRMTKIDEQKLKRLDRLSENRERKDESILDRRAGWDSHRAEHYDKLFGRASTTAQKEAVTKFQTTMERLVKERRAAVDAAHKTFRTGVDSAIATRKTSVEGSIATFKTALDAALSKAKTDCDGGKDPRVVREAYRTSSEAAREKMQDDRRAIEKTRAAIDPLIEARKAAINKALDAFKVGAEQARTELKAAFK